MRKSFWLGQALAFCAVLLWASAYVGTKIALENFSVTAIALVRCAVAALVLAAVLLARMTPLPPIRALPALLLTGVVGFGLYLPVFNKGSMALNPTTGCIVIATAPIITAFLARLRFRETLAGRERFAIALAFCGILTMTLWEGSLILTFGIVWMLLGAFLLSAHNILQRDLAPRFGPLPVTAFGFFAATLLLLPALPETASQITAAPPSRTLLICFLGVFPSAAAYLLWAGALAAAPKTSGVANHMFLTPFLTLILDFLVTGKLPPSGTFIGGTLILAGLMLAVSAGKKEQRPAPINESGALPRTPQGPAGP